MSGQLKQIKDLLTRRLQSMKDEAKVRRRFTLKQQVEEVEHLIKMMERELAGNKSNGDTTRSE